MSFDHPRMASHTDTDSDDCCNIYTNVVKKNFSAGSWTTTGVKIKDYEALLKQVQQDEEPSSSVTAEIVNNEPDSLQPSVENIRSGTRKKSKQQSTRNTRSRTTRRNRHNPSHLADNSPVAYINLDSLPPPEPRVELPIVMGSVIALDDSDGEDGSKADDGYLSIKVMWMSQDVQRIPMKKDDTMSVVFDHFTKLENVPREKLLFLLRDGIRVTATDTPHSLGLTVADIIDGGMVTTPGAAVQGPAAVEEVSLEFKLQRKGARQPIVLTVAHQDKLLVLMNKCAAQLQVPAKKMKLTFDGDLLDLGLTAGEQGLEGGECLDLYIAE